MANKKEELRREYEPDVLENFKKQKDGSTVFNTRDQIDVYAGKNSPFHEPGEKTSIHPRLLAKFKSLGFTTTAPEKKVVDKTGEGGLNPIAGGAPGTMTNKGTV